MSIGRYKMRYRVFLLLWCPMLTFFAGRAQAVTVSAVIPSTAPHGSRVVVTGTALDMSDLAVSFSAVGSQGVVGVVVSHTTSMLEVTVPPTAVTGLVSIANGSGTIGAFPFTVSPDTSYVKVATLAGQTITGNDHGDNSLLKEPGAVAVTPAGDIYVSDTKHHQIRLMSAGGTVTVFAGTGKDGYKDGPGAIAQFNEPRGIAYDILRKAVYVADTGNRRVRMIGADGMVSTIAGSGKDDNGGLQEPVGVALDGGGNLYVADPRANRIFVLNPSGVLSVLAGETQNGLRNGSASQARFKQPQGVTATTNGIVYVADTGNSVIRKIDLPDYGGVRQVTTVAGSGKEEKRDDEDGSHAGFNHPGGITLDEAGNLLVADTKSNCIRLVNQQQSPSSVTTIAGGTHDGLVDGVPASARFKEPQALATQAGAIYVADTGNGAIRAIYSHPALSEAFARRGPLAGANVIRLFGTGFVVGATDVKFGSTAPTRANVVVSTELLTAVPAGSPGSVDLTVTTPAGTAMLAGEYTYVPPPLIAAIDPRKGQTAGGQSAMITGSSFLDGGDTTVSIGGTDVAQLFRNGDTALTFATPPGTDGAAEVIVNTPGGMARLEGGFRYFASPVISIVTPASGTVAGKLTIAGEHFDPELSGNSVLFGNISAKVISSTVSELVTSVPALAKSAKITVTTPGGRVESEQTFVVTEPVQISIDSPGAGATVTSSHILVTGTASGPRDLGITVNGFPAEVDLTPTGSISDPFRWFVEVQADTGTVTLQATATTTTGATTSVSQDVTFSLSEAVVLRALPADGVAPLTVGFETSTAIEAAIVTYEFDLDGDGVYEISSATLPAPLSQDYQTPGIRMAKVRLTDANGAIYAAEAPVNIQSFPVMNALLKVIWSRFTDALGAGDVDAALNQLADGATRNKYREPLNRIRPTLRDFAAGITAIDPMWIEAGAAHYLLTRTEEGQLAGYHVYFLRDSKGIWRVAQF